MDIDTTKVGDAAQDGCTDRNEKRLKMELGEHQHLRLGWRKKSHEKGQGGRVRGVRTPDREILMILSNKMIPSQENRGRKRECSWTPDFLVNQHRAEQFSRFKSYIPFFPHSHSLKIPRMGFPGLRKRGGEEGNS